MSAKLSREDVERIVLDGFFPQCGPDDLPRRSTRVALQEFGLPYAQDPAVTRQLAGFLHTHSAAGRPNAILLNGGVFNSPAIASRLVEVISSWWPEGACPAAFACSSTIRSNSPSRAAPHGTAWFGAAWDAASAAGQRILFTLDWKQNAVKKPKALCLIPRGHEEGQTVELGGRTFNLTLGRPVQFPLFTSTSDRVVVFRRDCHRW